MGLIEQRDISSVGVISIYHDITHVTCDEPNQRYFIILVWRMRAFNIDEAVFHIV